MRKTLLLGIIAVACGPGASDPSMYLTGTETEPLVAANGALSCSSDKDLICHFPPGNPGNAHSICVGKPAWPPHRDHHGDTMGACAAGNGGDDSDGGSDDGVSGSGGGGADSGSGVFHTHGGVDAGAGQ